MGHDSVNQDRDARLIRMNAVVLVQIRPSGDSVQDEWIERDTVPPGEVRKDGVERLAIIASQIGRRDHPGYHGVS